MAEQHLTLDGYARETFTHEGATKDVYVAGDGPGVVVMTEIPGIHPPTYQARERVLQLFRDQLQTT